MFDIHEELKKLPQNSGVYIMRDEKEEIIYVGKAINLRNRVRQYFQESSKKSQKTRNLVENIERFEYIITDTEVEALLLENNLIKKHQPKYNILLRDDKTYPHIKITLNEMYPRVFSTRNVKKDKAKYYGPYTSGLVVKETVELIHKIWKPRRCFRRFPQEMFKGRPCLDYHIEQCLGCCNEHITTEDYNKIINEIMMFLGGKHKEILAELKTNMQISAETMDFEKAAKYRDKINAIKTISEKQKVDNASDANQDIIAFAQNEEEALVQIFFIRGGKMTGREHFTLKGTQDMEKEDIITAFVEQFYSETSFIPKEIILENNVNNLDIVKMWLEHLRQASVSIIVPQKGEKLKLIKMAKQNAEITLTQFGEQIKREKQRTEGAVEAIQNALGIDFVINRIEAYDISNIQGFESVGSMVVFEEGRPKRNDYRKFKIKSVLGPNDYASIEEVLTRRFLRYKKELEELTGNNAKEMKFLKLPDIIFIDGGKGQVGSAKKVLKELNMDILVCGMVKDDKHRTRGLYFEGEEVNFSVTSEAFRLITKIQDEVHRFAIEYHKSLRSKAQVRSVLDDIKGIGATRRTALIKHFGDIEKIKRAEIEELKQAEGMNIKAAEAVYNFFRGKQSESENR